MKPKISTSLLIAALGLAGLASGQAPEPEPRNPNVRFEEFAEVTAEVQKLRSERLLSEEQFLKLAADPGTVVLDARSKDDYEQGHVKGAVNLPYTDFSAEALAKVIPRKGTRVLICSNNLKDVALNIPTFITLYSYGYTNVRELEPLVEVKTSKIPFAGKSVK